MEGGLSATVMTGTGVGMAVRENIQHDPIVNFLLRKMNEREITPQDLWKMMGCNFSLSAIKDWCYPERSGVGFPQRGPRVKSLRRWADAMGYELCIRKKRDENGSTDSA